MKLLVIVLSFSTVAYGFLLPGYLNLNCPQPDPNQREAQRKDPAREVQATMKILIRKLSLLFRVKKVKPIPFPWQNVPKFNTEAFTPEAWLKFMWMKWQRICISSKKLLNMLRMVDSYVCDVNPNVIKNVRVSVVVCPVPITPKPLDRIWRNSTCVMHTLWGCQKREKITILRKINLNFAICFQIFLNTQFSTCNWSRYF